VTRQTPTLQYPIYTVSADGTTGVAPDFRRVQDVRLGYGYPGLADPYKGDLAPRDNGIFQVDLASKAVEDLKCGGSWPGLQARPATCDVPFEQLL